MWLCVCTCVCNIHMQRRMCTFTYTLTYTYMYTCMYRHTERVHHSAFPLSALSIYIYIHTHAYNCTVKVAPKIIFTLSLSQDEFHALTYTNKCPTSKAPHAQKNACSIKCAHAWLPTRHTRTSQQQQCQTKQTHNHKKNKKIPARSWCARPRPP